MVINMAKVVSVIPKPNKGNRAQIVNGTQILLSDGSHLEGVQKVTLVAEVDNFWKAIIEVVPTNQQQINAVLEDLKVVDDETQKPETTTSSGQDDDQ